MLAKDLATRKSQVEYLYNDILVSEALERMEKKKFAMIPVLERGSSRYLYSLSEGDLLRFVIQVGSLRRAGKRPLSSVSIERLIVPVKEEADISALLDLAPNQPFLPLIDDKGVFRGIVTRKSLLHYLTPNTPTSEEGE